MIGVPFVTAKATSLAQTRYVNEEIEAMLQRLVDRADGDIAQGAAGHRLHRRNRQAEGLRRRDAQRLRRSVQHALLKIMEGFPVKLGEAVHRHDEYPVHLRRRIRRPRRDRRAVAGLRVHLDERRGQPEDPRPAEHAREADRPVRVRPDPGIHRAAADRRPLQESLARKPGADHDRTEELDLQQFLEIFRNEGVELSLSRRYSSRSPRSRSSTGPARAACAASSRK